MARSSRKGPDEPNSLGSRILAKAALSMDPVTASAEAQLQGLIQPALLKRLHQIVEDLVARLHALEAAGRLTVADLVENDGFVDATVRALEAARKTGQAEKLEALRNAILNAALDSPPDESQRHVFLEMVDRFTVWHLRILRAFDDPAAWATAHNVNYRPAMTSSLDAFLLAAFPELSGRQPFYDLLWSELWLSKLVNTDQLHSNMSDRGWLAPQTSEMGKAFLAFIAQP